MRSTPSARSGPNAGTARSSADGRGRPILDGRAATQEARDVRPELADELPRHRRYRPVCGVEHAELELESGLEWALDNAAACGVFGRGEGLAERDADARADKRADNLRQRRLDAHHARDAMLGEQAIDAKARHGRRAKRDEVLALEIARPDLGLAREAVVPRQDGDIGRRRHALGLHGGMPKRDLGKAEIALALGNGADDGM